MSEDKSLTIAVNNDQTLFQAVAYNIHSGSKRQDRPEGGMYINEADISRTLDTSGGLEPSKNDGGVAIVAPATIVRRLTPTECERLQGFPDGWTAQRIDFKTSQLVEQKDSARYKQMGNAVAVPCVQWLMGRIITALDTNV